MILDTFIAELAEARLRRRLDAHGQLRTQTRMVRCRPTPKA